MSLDLDRDLAVARRDLDAARHDLLASLAPLADADLDRSRRGGWQVRRILQHVIQAEWHYVHAVAQLRGRAPPAPAPVDLPASVAEAGRALTAAREALLAALDGIDEATFYRLAPVGREEFSVLSVLENTAQHDREHAQQLRAAVARD